jgi:YVTN family beta-propeller protein
VINTKRDKVVATIKGLGSDSLGIAVTPNGKRAYVTNYGGSADEGGTPGTTVSVINLKHKEVVATIDGFGPNPTGVAITPDGTRAYVMNEGANTVSVIDTDPSSRTFNTIIGDPIQVGFIPVSVAITPDGTRAYVTNLFGAGPPPFSLGTVSVIDTDPSSPTFHTVVKTIEVGRQPLGIATAPDGTKVYVVNQGNLPIPVNPPPGYIPTPPSISVIDTDPSSQTFNTVINTIEEGLGRESAGVAVTPDGAKLYVTNNSTDQPELDPDTVSVIDTETNTVIDEIPVVNQPSGVVIIRGQSRWAHDKED